LAEYARQIARFPFTDKQDLALIDRAQRGQAGNHQAAAMQAFPFKFSQRLPDILFIQRTNVEIAPARLRPLGISREVIGKGRLHVVFGHRIGINRQTETAGKQEEKFTHAVAQRS
jgi:hypothetical protein